MRELRDIINVALREHDHEQDLPSDVEGYADDILQRINAPAQIATFSSSSKPLTLVSFQCLMQDTGFPMEVYLPEPVSGGQPDMSQLAERWVGWATEIPGQQIWSKGDFASQVNGLSSSSKLPPAVTSKYPLGALQPDYLGALVKVYDDVSFKPASIYTVTGILSSAALPASLHGDGDDEDQLVMVPTVHVLIPPEPLVVASTSSTAETRTALLDYLSSSFSPPDPIAAELLLLLLISGPISRPVGQSPLGTFSLNLLCASSTAFSKSLIPVLESLLPYVVPLPLSVPFLHSAQFVPRSVDSTNLDAGLLQLAPGTLLAVQEGEMGDGGQLAERAIKNLQALSTAFTTQVVGYEYPYMDGLKMECAIRGLVFSEGKTLLPVDVHLPLLPSSTATSSPPADPNLAAFRSYLSLHSSAQHASKISIPDEVAERIQDDFVMSRQSADRLDVESAEARLKRRMRIARLLAQSYPDAILSIGVWDRAVELDEEAENRMKSRQTRPTA